MSMQLWVGVVFSGALVVFLMITFFVKDISPSQHNLLRFFTALCGGFAAGCITGEALFSLHTGMSSGANISISGAAGFAIMLTIWFSYPTYKVHNILNEQFDISLPDGWTFEQAVRAIAKGARGVVIFEGFNYSQMNVILPSADITAMNPEEALRQLQYLSTNVPHYQVIIEDGVYRIRA